MEQLFDPSRLKAAYWELQTFFFNAA